MQKIAICDDERETRRKLAECVRAFPRPVTVEEFDSGERLLASEHAFDVILLDIDMRGMDGIEAARRLRQRDKKAKIIYVTAYGDYQSYAFGVHAFGYLLKPVKKEQILKQLEEAFAYTREEEPAVILPFETSEGIVEVDLRDIYYFEYVSRKIRMKTKAGCYWIRGSITELGKKMAAYDFCVPHKSFVVNLMYVKSIKGYDITMLENSLIPLSQKKSVEFRERLNQYLAGRL